MKYMQKSKSMLKVSKTVQDHFLTSRQILWRGAL